MPLDPAVMPENPQGIHAGCGHYVDNPDDLVTRYYKNPKGGVIIKPLCPDCAKTDKGDFKTLKEGNEQASSKRP